MGVSRGFTLLELLVVLAVMALVYAVAFPFVGGDYGGVDLKAAAYQVAAGLRRTRNVAVAQRQEATFTLDVDQRRFVVTGDPKAYSLPSKLDIVLYTAQSELVQGKSANIRFYPDGSSTGGRVTLAAGKQKLNVNVDWLTGKVSIE